MIEKILTPTIRATIPNTTTTKKIIAPTTTNKSFNNGTKADTPNVITVVHINANTPIGASFKILLIIQNTASNVPLRKPLTGSAFSLLLRDLNQRILQKNIIGNKSPLANDSNRLVGTIFTIVSIK